MPSSLVTRMFIRATRPARPSRIFTISSSAGPDLGRELGLERLAGRRAQLAGAPVLVDLLPRALDGVLLGVQQVLHQQDQLDFAALVDPVARAVLGRVEEAELALPVPQHVRLEVGELADLADGIKLLDRPGGGHRHCSALSSRSISSGTASRGRLPLEQDFADLLDDRHLHARRAGRAPTPARVVLAPSATVAVRSRGSAPASRPAPARRPARDCGSGSRCVVSTRSPMPGEPGEGERVGAERDAQPRDLRQPAGDERRARVVAEPQPLEDARPRPR